MREHDPFGPVQRLLRSDPSEVTRFAAMLPSDTAHALFTALQERVAADKDVHDHPPRPYCWSCGIASRNLMHSPTCRALIAAALELVNAPENAEDVRRRGWSYRRRYGMVLDIARSLGFDVSSVRPNAHALHRWCGVQSPPLE